MYTVLLAVKSNIILQELKRLRIWGASSGFEICEVVSDLKNLPDRLRKVRCHLILLEANRENQEEVLTLIRTIKKENLCRAVAVVDQDPDFKMVRRSFLLGVEDYLATPFEASHFITLFNRIEHVEHGKIAVENGRKEELCGYFERRDQTVKTYLDELLYTVISEYITLPEALDYVERLLGNVMEDLFQRHEWLKLYFLPEGYKEERTEFPDYEELIQKSLEDFYSFFTEFSELYPIHGEGLEEILLYILNRPEGDLKQKTISEALYINRSYLSTVFAAQMQVNFVDYVNMVKMKRAAYLLKYTKMKVIDIAGKLDYKDMGYFLKKFKAKYGVTPSQYRIPETYEFQI